MRYPNTLFRGGIARLLVVAIVGSSLLGGCEAYFGDPSSWDADDGLEVAASREGLEAWQREGEWLVSPPLSAEDGVARVVAMTVLSADAELPPLEARVIEDGWAGPWRPLGEVWGEQSHHVAEVDFDGSGQGVQLRIAASAREFLEQLRFTAVGSAALAAVDEVTEAPDEGVGAAREALRTQLRSLGVVPREDWGARRTRCTSRDAAKRRMAIHYTVTPSSNPERQVRAIQAYHQRRGWCDVGYHFLVGIDGTIYEGRPLHLLGAHVGGNNTGNIGISFIGCFHPTSRCSSWGPVRPPEVMLRSAARLISRLSDIYGISIDGSRIKGHRDHRGASTNCPGDHLYERIPDLLAMARDGAAVDGRADSGGAPPPMPPPPEPERPAAESGASCTHSQGGHYGHQACSASYQCCDGRWTLRSSGCGACTCVEETGRRGCSADTGSGASEPPADPPPSAPSDEAAGSVPPGASCLHSYGGLYANTACSASYQCCDGRWRLGHGACGACFCTETTGALGCGGTSGAAPDVYAGLSQSGSEVPRAGLYNPTLRRTLGISREPYGTVTSYDGVPWVRGRISWFGGPADRGISRSARGAITGERVRLLNDPLDPDPATLASRPEDYYWVAMRFSYSPNGVRFWRDARLVLRNPVTGAAVVVRPVDWGPHTRTRRIVDVSSQTMRDLGLSTDDDVLVAFAPPGTPLGPVR